MKATRVLDLLTLGAFATIIAFALVTAFYSEFPAITAFAGASLYPVAALEVLMAFVIRSRLKEDEIGMSREQLHPITAARALALAKASALVGSASTGVWLGFLGFILTKQSQSPAAVSDRPGVLVGLFGGIALTAAALWLEHCCKAPDEPPEEPAM